ncbi:hypothetical protein LZ31DRAFT_325596 [Colletotrichum somersetense]|nr:hypothetical protein LZ31DRAFT_325596 [Colletotrichum somersetense]
MYCMYCLSIYTCWRWGFFFNFFIISPCPLAASVPEPEPGLPVGVLRKEPQLLRTYTRASSARLLSDAYLGQSVFPQVPPHVTPSSFLVFPSQNPSVVKQYDTHTHSLTHAQSLSPLTPPLHQTPLSLFRPSGPLPPEHSQHAYWLSSLDSPCHFLPIHRLYTTA